MNKSAVGSGGSVLLGASGRRGQHCFGVTCGVAGLLAPFPSPNLCLMPIPKRLSPVLALEQWGSHAQGV